MIKVINHFHIIRTEIKYLIKTKSLIGFSLNLIKWINLLRGMMNAK